MPCYIPRRFPAAGHGRGHIKLPRVDASLCAVSRGSLRRSPETPHVSWFCSNLSHLFLQRRCPCARQKRLHASVALATLCSVEPSAAATGAPGLRRPSSGRVLRRCQACPIGASGRRQAPRAGQESEGKTGARPRGPRQGTNRMNSFPDSLPLSPALPPAVRELAALCEYSEGSHEANARQRNSGRGVARRTG